MSARATGRKVKGFPDARATASARVTTSYGGAATRAATSGTGRQARNGRRRIDPPYGVDGRGPRPGVGDATGPAGRASRGTASTVNSQRSTGRHVRTPDDLPPLHDQSHPSNISDRYRRISLHRHEIRHQAGLDPAQPVVQVKDPRVAGSGRPDPVQD